MIRLLLSALLLSAIYWSYSMFQHSVEQPARVASAGLGITEYQSEIKKLGSVAEYESISRNPLFDEDRTPQKKVVQKKVVRKKVVNDELKVQGLGIALSAEGILAVLKDLRNGKNVRLRINDELNGWALKGVSENSFIFAKDNAEKIIKFKNERE